MATNPGSSPVAPTPSPATPEVPAVKQSMGTSLTPPQVPPPKEFLRLTRSDVIALFAVVVAVATAVITYAGAEDSSNAEVIKTEYDTFNELNKMQVEHFEQLHLYALEDNYSAISAQVALAVSPLDEQRRAELLLRERVTALYVFTMFEQALYRWEQSRHSFNSDRTNFMQAVVDYYTGRVLRNPRLLYLWGPGAMSKYFEVSTIEYYNQHVKDLALAPRDPVGPFGPATAKTRASAANPQKPTVRETQKSSGSQALPGVRKSSPVH
jgi:hypothetical protein